MKLLPSLRQKKRYVVFEIISSDTFSFSDVEVAVKNALLQFLGELSMAKASPILLKEKFHENRFIMKINNTHVDELKASLTLIKKIKNKHVILKSIITSGTLKKASASLK